MGATARELKNDEKRKTIVPCKYWFHLSDKHIVYLFLKERTFEMHRKVSHIGIQIAIC